MELGLAGKVALVTGASRGIGRAIALCLAEEGMDLVLAARSTGELEALKGAIEQRGRRALPYAADLSEPAAPAAAVAAAVATFGRLDLLVNNAGATKRGDFFALDEADWTAGFALKFFGYVRATRAAWPHLRASGGTVVNIVGVGGRQGSAEFTIGGSVNAGILNFTKAMADIGVKDGVRVNAVNPGSIATDRLNIRIDNAAREYGIDREAAAKRLVGEMGIARFGEPEEIAAAVAFLASDKAGYLQGAILDVDGGLTRAL